METKFLRTSLIATVCFFSVSVGLTDAYGMDKDEQLIRYEHQLITCPAKVKVISPNAQRTESIKDCKIFGTDPSGNGSYRCENCQLTMKLINNLKSKK